MNSARRLVARAGNSQTLWSIKRKKLAAAVALALITLPTLTKALSPDVSVFKDAEEVSDEELSGMRGRFATASNQIVHFGVEMVSQWTTANGAKATAALNVEVNSQLRPVITVYTSQTDGSSQANDPPNHNVTIKSGGITQVSSVAQSIQIGGDKNNVQNTVVANITMHSSDSSANNASGVSWGGTQINGPGTQTSTSNSGTTTTVNVGKNGISVGIYVPDQGSVIQQIRGNTGQGAAGLLQSAQITGDLNRVTNQLKLTADLRASTGVSTAGMQGALGMLRGLRLPGAV